MSDIVRLRAHRFEALYQLLTGVAHAELPQPYSGSDHLRKDVGLPPQANSGLTFTHVGKFQTDPFDR
ncbi:hypothetical protein Q4555_16045 [Octadecabacter sp. 1_MG-2023]|uniref:hypothetical protein n=1 Tax=unclassified Octadecabacter TaxID=196158 RepID=UPI001C084222|nr:MULTISPECIES: hypothetical protein [unclassified Octadecabacter]MBU2991663.1 hypothetical protein [Octadecabacter sp. B2R22]MDO6736189.1 hypothetical protein [Octadecabacter sp. 1_MG-2023]